MPLLSHATPNAPWADRDESLVALRQGGIVGSTHRDANMPHYGEVFPGDPGYNGLGDPPAFDRARMNRERDEAVRDQFAMAALTGLCANPEVMGGIPLHQNVRTQEDMERLSSFAFFVADAMLAARKK